MRLTDIIRLDAVVQGAERVRMKVEEIKSDLISDYVNDEMKSYGDYHYDIEVNTSEGMTENVIREVVEASFAGIPYTLTPSQGALTWRNYLVLIIDSGTLLRQLDRIKEDAPIRRTHYAVFRGDYVISIETSQQALEDRYTALGDLQTDGTYHLTLTDEDGVTDDLRAVPIDPSIYSGMSADEGTMALFSAAGQQAPVLTGVLTQPYMLDGRNLPAYRNGQPVTYSFIAVP